MNLIDRDVFGFEVEDGDEPSAELVAAALLWDCDEPASSCGHTYSEVVRGFRMSGFVAKPE